MSTLIENSKRLNLGPIPALDIVKDLTPKKDYDANSWYLSGSFEIDGCKVELKLNGEDYPLYCGGNGEFAWSGMTSHQYSLPYLRSNGSITMNGKTYEVKDQWSWFDRQWQNNNPATLMKLMCAWMDMRLDNGDIVSLWTNGDGEQEHT